MLVFYKLVENSDQIFGLELALVLDWDFLESEV